MDTVAQQGKDLEALERRIYRDYHQDGIWDIFLGAYFLISGLLFLYASSSSYMGIYAGLMIIVAHQLKQRVTAARIGQVNFSRARVNRERRGTGGLATALVVTALLGGVVYYFVASVRGVDSAGFDPRFLLGVLFVPVLVLVARQFGISRYYLHAAIILSIFVATSLLGVEMTRAFILTGLVITTYGVWLFVRFLLRHPRVASDA